MALYAELGTALGERLGVLEVQNVGGNEDYANYAARLYHTWEDIYPDMNPPLVEGSIVGYPRAEGPYGLLAEALNNISHDLDGGKALVGLDDEEGGVWR